MKLMDRFQLFILFSLFFILFSCDFTPTINRNILEAQNLVLSQKYDKAATLYEEILKEELTPEIRTKIFYQLAELYSTYFNKQDIAVKYYTNVLNESEDSFWVIKAQEKIAEISFSYLANYNESARTYKSLMEIMPKLEKYDFYKFRYALSLLELKNFDLAMDEFSSLSLDKGSEYYARSYYYIGIIYFEKKDWAKSISSWQTYIKLEPRRDFIVHTKFLIANAYETQEELKKAYDMYYSILSDYPNPDVIQNRLNAIYARRVARRR